MPQRIIEGLTPDAASDICMNQCRAMCCRGPAILSLSAEEARDFEERAGAAGLAVTLADASDGGRWLRFSDHEGERCPMLDETTWACRIYEHRPQRCRDFPDRPVPDCAIARPD